MRFGRPIPRVPLALTPCPCTCHDPACDVLLCSCRHPGVMRTATTGVYIVPSRKACRSFDPEPRDIRYSHRKPDGQPCYIGHRPMTACPTWTGRSYP